MLAVGRKAEESFEENETELSEDTEGDVKLKSYSSVTFDNDNHEDVSHDDSVEDSDDHEDISSEDEEGSDEHEDISSEDEEDSDEDGDVSHEDDSGEDSDEQEDSEVNDKQKDVQDTTTSSSKIVEGILARDAEARNAIAVSKVVELQFDLGRLLASDLDSLDLKALRKSKDKYLLNLARDNTQLLINRIWELPISREGTEILAKLPAPAYKLPRAKPIPKPKAPTKWEKFALEKGISKKKRGKLQWDEELQKWVPWYGYRRARAEREKNWMAEVGEKDDPWTDPFAKKKAEKKERVAKNEYQRLRNIAAGHGAKIPRAVESLKKVESKKQKKEAPRVGFLTADNMNSKEMKRAITVAKSSTASLGVFQKKIPEEKNALGVSRILPMKRKVTGFLKPKEESDNYLNLVDKIVKKMPKIDIDRAVNKQFHKEEQARAEEKKNKGPRGRGGKRGGGGKGGGKRGGGGKGGGRSRGGMGGRGGGKGDRKGRR